MLRLWYDKWRVRRYWKVRPALPLVSLAVMAWYWTIGGPFLVFAGALALPVVVNLAFWKSDERAEKQRKAQLAADTQLARPRRSTPNASS